MPMPMARLGNPVSKAPAKSHSYSHMSHVVFGMTTDADRKLFRRFPERVGAASPRSVENSPALRSPPGLRRAVA
jgi:hypothetical protein